ncbi:MAG: chaperonin GroEL [Chloroflexota bacterium]|nr:chaperonin GroEL [Chloroflexota bacterium]
MPPKGVKFSDEARRDLIKGVDLLADIVGSTYGPRGRNVMYERFQSAEVTNDGDQIAKQFAESYSDPYMNIGVQIVKEAAMKTGEAVGDGTTSSVVLTQSIARQGLRNLAAGANAMILKRGIDRAAKMAHDHVRSIARPVASSEDIERVASIAANDPEIGEYIAEVMERVGNDGMVQIDESRSGVALSTRYVEGMQLDKGWVSPYFVTNAERMEAYLDRPRVLLADSKISSAGAFAPFLDKILAAGIRNLFIVATNIDGDALALLIMNKLRGKLNVAAIKAPSYGERMRSILMDIGAMTGATVFSDHVGFSWQESDVSWLGHADRVTIGRLATILLESPGHDAAVQARAEQIRTQLDATESDWDREKLEERLARLTGGVGIISVGAATEVELRERKTRAEDGVSTTRAAVHGGIVPGGGACYLRAAESIDLELFPEGDERTGAAIVKRALHGPLRRIAANAGAVPSLVIDSVLSSDDPWHGWNADSDEFGDLYEMGVVDAANVACIALDNATSAGTMLLTTEAMVAELPQPAAPVSPESMARDMHNMGVDGF